MKQNYFVIIFLSILFFSTGLFGQGQIPGNSFETWFTPISSVPSLVEPEGFVTSNVFGANPNLPGDYTTCTQSSDAAVGDSSAKLEVKGVAANMPQLISTGAYTSMGVGELKIPYTDRPDQFQVWLKGEMLNNDTAFVFVEMTRWDATAGAAVSIGESIIEFSGNNGTWTEFTQDFTYTAETDAPDSLVMQAIIFGPNANGTPGTESIGSTLYLDGLNLVSNSTGLFTPLMPEINVRLYPNPTSDIATFEVDENDVAELEQISIFAIDGRMVSSHAINGSKTQANVTGLPAGTYHYRISDKEGNIVNGGKLNIAH